jgi:hypothetical protein
VQGFVADDASDDGESFEAVTCIVCDRLHYINPRTGRVLGEND